MEGIVTNYSVFIMLIRIIGAIIDIVNNYGERICTMPMYIPYHAYVTTSRSIANPQYAYIFKHHYNIKAITIITT